MKTFFLIIIGSVAMYQEVSALKGVNTPLSALPTYAAFPHGVFNSSDPNACSAKALRLLPQKCAAALNENSTDFERFGCNLIRAPGTQGIIPFGMYPTSMLLNKDLGDISSQSLTDIFDECAMAKMIEDHCFIFKPNSLEAQYKTMTYSTENEYQQSISQSYGIDVGISAGYGPVTVNAGITTLNGHSSSKEGLSQSAGASRTWSQSVGTISFTGCGYHLPRYFKKEYLEKWNNVAMYKNSTELQNDADFQKLMELGFYIPAKFAMAIQYGASVSSTYQMTSATASDTASDALTAGVDVGTETASVGIAMTMASTITTQTQQSGIDMTANSQETKFGMCDFTKMLADNGANWMGTLSECSEKVIGEPLLLDRAAYVERNGFLSVIDILTKYANIDIKQSVLLPAMNEYFATCKCDAPWNGQVTKTYTCRYGNGVFKSSGTAVGSCTSVSWFERSLPAFLTQIVSLE